MLPGWIIQELPQIESVVVCSVVFAVVGWGQHSALVAIDRVELEKSLHLFSNLARSEIARIRPMDKQMIKHGKGTLSVDFP